MPGYRGIVELANTWYESIFGCYWQQDYKLDFERVVQWFGELECACHLAMAAIEEAADGLAHALQRTEAEYDHYRATFDGDVIARLAEWLGGAELPSSGRFTEIRDAVDELRGRGRDRHFDGVAGLTEWITRHSAQLATDWDAFCQDALDGAQLGLSIASVTRDTSVTVLAGLATGGLTSAWGVTSTIGKLALGSGVAMAATAAERAVTVTTRFAIGVREPFHFDEDALPILEAGALQFVGGIGGDVVAARMAGALKQRMLPVVADWAGNVIGTMAADATEIAVKESVGTLFQTAVVTSGHAAVGHDFDGPEGLAAFILDDYTGRSVDNFVQSTMAHLGEHGGGVLDADKARHAVKAALWEAYAP